MLVVAGRVLFGGYFLMMALNHFKNRAMMVGYAASKGVPQASVAVVGSGILLLLGGIYIVFGFYIPAAVLFLTLFLVPVSFKMHAFWAVTDPQMKMAEQVNFMKNMALLGAVWMMLAIPQPWVPGIM